jgi:hypothetical protein
MPTEVLEAAGKAIMLHLRKAQQRKSAGGLAEGRALARIALKAIEGAGFRLVQEPEKRDPPCTDEDLVATLEREADALALACEHHRRVSAIPWEHLTANAQRNRLYQAKAALTLLAERGWRPPGAAV